MTHVSRWQRLVGMVKCELEGVVRWRFPMREMPKVYRSRCQAESLLSELWAANHWVAIDGAAVKLPDSQALHCQPQLGARRGKKL
jgi:hypothetical protein